MTRKLGEIFMVLAALTTSLAVGCQNQDAAAPPESPGESTAKIARESTVVIGTVVPDPEELEKKRTRAQLLIAYMSSRLGDHGVRRGELVLAQSPVEMANLMRLGKVDLYYDTVFASFVGNKLSESDPFLSRWKKGVHKYHSTIIVKLGGGITSQDDLKGKMIAFEDPSSTSAYFLPKTELLKLGFNLTEKSSPTDPVSSDEIGFYFTMSDEQVVANVMNGVAAAGGQQQKEIVEYLQEAGKPENSFHTLLTTSEIYRSMFTVRRNLDASLKSALRQLMLDMDKDPKGQAALKAFAKTTKFTEFEPTPEVAFAAIRPLVELVEKEIIQR